MWHNVSNCLLIDLRSCQVMLFCSLFSIAHSIISNLLTLSGSFTISLSYSLPSRGLPRLDILKSEKVLIKIVLDNCSHSMITISCFGVLYDWDFHLSLLSGALSLNSIHRFDRFSSSTWGSRCRANSLMNWAEWRSHYETMCIASLAL